MTVIDTKGNRKPAIIENEIRALMNLVDRRDMWLNKAENKLRRTYPAVRKDTNEMKEKLRDLRKELEEVTQPINS